MVDTCFDYAEEMLAENEKRKDKSRPEVLEEWQPDWSQAPDWANYWSMDIDGRCFWYANKSEIINKEEWFDDGVGSAHIGAPRFNYQGEWMNSLRKRP